MAVLADLARRTSSMLMRWLVVRGASDFRRFIIMEKSRDGSWFRRKDAKARRRKGFPIWGTLMATTMASTFREFGGN
jgi:hypothetical protein